MASGGFRPNKSSKSSEPKRRSNWQHAVSSDRDDAQSLNSLPSDVRINNWDLSDLRPSNLNGDTKRHKKSKGNPEREREQSLSMDSPPHDRKHYMPSSYSRGKLAASSLTSQRLALENLKQHMTFSDLEDQVSISTDGERNNERQASQGRRRLHNASFNRTDSEDDGRGRRDRHKNRNNNMDYANRQQGPDSNEIVAHLMQIKDFTKQAKSMLDSMEKLGDRKKAEDIEKVRRLIRNLQEQEQGYRGLLQNKLTRNSDSGSAAARGGEGNTALKAALKFDSDEDTSVDLGVRSEESDTTENSQDSRPRIESKLGIESEDDDDDDNEDDGEDDQFGVSVRGATVHASDTLGTSKTLEPENSTSLSMLGGPIQESEEGARGSTAVNGDATLSHHQELLKILKEKQQQLQALMNRQEELNLKRRETEKKLLDAQARDNNARAALVAVNAGRQLLEQHFVANQAELGSELAATAWQVSGEDDGAGALGEDRQLKSNIVGYPESDDEDNSKVCEVEGLPSELLELKRELNYLRNEFSQVSEAPKNVESDEGRRQLQNKLQELQSKKSHMDMLLQELQRLNAQPLDSVRNNEANAPVSNVHHPVPAASNIPPPKQHKKPPTKTGSANPSASAAQTSGRQPRRANEISLAVASDLGNEVASMTQLARETVCEQESGEADVGLFNEMQEKLRHLKEVRGQLDQLKGIVQFYQDQKSQMEAAVNGVGPPTMPAFIETPSRAQTVGSRSSLSSLPQLPPPHQQLQQQPHQLLQQQPHQLLQQQPHQLLQQQPLQQLQQQLRNAKEGVNPSLSLHTMMQLPNLAGTDQGGELSDEDNVSVSHTDSQWSNLGPWDDDPEIQEKVRKLKAAKEKLRQLQDLVAFVQQPPDLEISHRDDAGDLTSGAECEAVSHATQTDDPSMSVEGDNPSEAPSTQSKEDETRIDNQRAEIKSLRKERSMLLEIQNQLKNIHSQANMGTNQEEVQQRPGSNTELRKSDLESIPSTTVVTFASNDELYSKMRRQRMLREELRTKKKELEAIMKKDRNKRQYSRNQDTQSDTVSLNTDTFGIPASVDATMATWGGSTIDNLENITEDEGGQNRSRSLNRDEDDGYPSDGILQVEEEEEENNSEDGTYTIERNVRQRPNQIAKHDVNRDLGARPKTARGRPTSYLPNQEDVKKSLKKQNGSYQNTKIRQEESTHSLKLQKENEDQNSSWFRSIEDKLTHLSSTVETLVRKSDTDGRQLIVPSGQGTESSSLQPGNLLSPVQEQMLQLQNQSMMLSFSHLVQSLTHQQGDIQQLQQQLHAVQLQVQELQHEYSFHGGSTARGGHPPLLHSALSNTGLNSSSYNLPATAALGVHSHTLSHPQAPSPFTQGSINHTHSPGLHTAPPGRMCFSPGSLGMDRSVVGASGPGNSLTVNTGSSLSLPQHSSASTLTSVFQAASHAPGVQQQQVPQDLGGDFGQFVSNVAATGAAVDNMFGDFSNCSGSSSHQNLAGRYNISRGGETQGREQKYDRRKKNKVYGLAVKKSESDPTSGLKVPAPKLESTRREDANSSDLYPWQRQSSAFRSVPGGASSDNVGNFLGGPATLSEASSYSSVDILRDKHSRLSNRQMEQRSQESANTLFDIFRETIYAEVASLISQNESRPQFLLELFRDMRKIDSDSMRQRALHCMQQVLTSNQISSAAASSPSHFWSKVPATETNIVNNEPTPSMSINSEEDEEEEDEDDDDIKDGLGETVIEFEHLKRKHEEQELFQDDTSRPENRPLGALGHREDQKLGQLLRYLKDTRPKEKTARPGRNERHLSGGPSSLVADQGSESSTSDLPYARIDVKTLDGQVKEVMRRAIPVVKEHMEEVCSVQLLDYIKQLVMSLTDQVGTQEFARYFQLQLASILEDTLHKYEGKRMRDCGEDLVLEISDVLFNELAFFRLMQDLDDPSTLRNMQLAEWPSGVSKEDNSSEYVSTSSSSSFEDEKDDEDKNGDGCTDRITHGNGAHTEQSTADLEHENLGRDRDNELDSDMRGTEDKEDDESERPYTIELAPSETKPFTRIGSDEDDDEGDEEMSMDDPSETAVSRDSFLEINGHTYPMIPLTTRPETEGAQGDGTEKQDQEKPVSPRKVKQLGDGDNLAPPPSGDSPEAGVETSQMNGTLNGESEEMEEVTLEDLPERLTVPLILNSAVAAPVYSPGNVDQRQDEE